MIKSFKVRFASMLRCLPKITKTRVSIQEILISFLRISPTRAYVSFYYQYPLLQQGDFFITKDPYFPCGSVKFFIH